MKCNQCGCEFNEGIFCPKCGARVEMDEETLKLVDVDQLSDLEKEKIIKERTEKEIELAKLELQKKEIEEKEKEEAKKKKIDRLSLISLILGIICWPAFLTVFLPYPLSIIGIILGVKSIRSNTTKKGRAIAGIVLSALVWIVTIAVFILQ